MKRVLSLLLFVCLFGVGMFASAQDYILFYGNGCPHCARVEKFAKEYSLSKKFDFVFKEIYFNKNNLLELQWYLEKLNLDSSQIGVPFLVINNENECSYINGSAPIIDFFQKKLDILAVSQDENMECNVQNCAWLQCEWHTLEDIQNITNGSVSLKQTVVQDESSTQDSLPGSELDLSDTPSQESSISVNNWEFNRWKFFAIMLPAALSDSINPCEFAVVLLLVSTILVKTKSRKKALLSGWLFVLAVFVSYFAMWLGLFSALANAQNTSLIKIIVGILGILVWLANLKDFFWYGKWFVMEVPLAWRPKMVSLIEKVTSPLWAFVVGLIVSLFLLPCTSWPYFTILGYLASESKTLHTWWYIYLLVYNIIFVLPMIVITLLVSLGFKTVEELAALKKKNTKLIHLIVWLLMLGLGIYVLLNL
jgi:cytochrome c biogenesis protein CcdA/glutaredoxin